MRRSSSARKTPRREHGRDDRGIVVTAGLGQCGRAEVDRQQRDRPLLAGIADRRLAAITRLVEGGVRQSHQHRAWQPRTDIGLHLNDSSLEANQSHRPCAGGGH